MRFLSMSKTLYFCVIQVAARPAAVVQQIESSSQLSKFITLNELLVPYWRFLLQLLTGFNLHKIDDFVK